MRLTLLLSSLAACSAEPAPMSPPPGACAVTADHVLTPQVFGGGVGMGQQGGRATYSTDMQLIDTFRSVGPGHTIGFEIDIDPDAHVTRADVLDGSVYARGDGTGPGAAGIPMTVLDVVTASGLHVDLGTAELYPGPVSGFSWSADLGPFTYGEEFPCFGVVLQVPLAAAMPPSFDIALSWAGWTTSVAVPNHAGDPLRQGPLPPTIPGVRLVGSCNQMPILVEVDGATPFGDVALVSGQLGGSTRIPSGRCAGGQIPLSGVQLRRVLHTDGAGYHAFRVTMPPQVCQNLQLAAVDLTSCLISP